MHEILRFCFLLCIAGIGSAVAQEHFVINTPDGDPNGPTPVPRPLDDSDPEMRDLLESLIARGTCGKQDGCPERRKSYEDGGGRLAAYMIRQYQASIEEGYYAHYLIRRIAYTSSESAYQYLRSRVESGPNEIGRMLGLPRFRRQLR